MEAVVRIDDVMGTSKLLTVDVVVVLTQVQLAAMLAQMLCGQQQIFLSWARLVLSWTVLPRKFVGWSGRKRYAQVSAWAACGTNPRLVSNVVFGICLQVRIYVAGTRRQRTVA